MVLGDRKEAARLAPFIPSPRSVAVDPFPPRRCPFLPSVNEHC